MRSSSILFCFFFLLGCHHPLSFFSFLSLRGLCENLLWPRDQGFRWGHLFGEDPGPGRKGQAPGDRCPRDFHPQEKGAGTLGQKGERICSIQGPEQNRAIGSRGSGGARRISADPGLCIRRGFICQPGDDPVGKCLFLCRPLFGKVFQRVKKGRGGGQRKRIRSLEPKERTPGETLGIPEAGSLKKPLGNRPWCCVTE
jgi:hypothetical protein